MSRDPARKVTEAVESTRWGILNERVVVELERGERVYLDTGGSIYLEPGEARLLADTLLAAAEVLESRKES